MPYDHFRSLNTPYARRPIARQASLIPTSITDAIGRVIDLIRRRSDFNTGVDETSYFPFSSICRLTMRYPGNASEYQGTGFYIDDNLILTAGHNLLDSGNLASSIKIQPGYNARNVFPEFSVGNDALEVHPNYQNGNDVGFDMGVIHVTKGPPGGHVFKLINYSPQPGTSLALSGYGIGQNASPDKQHLDIATFKELSHGGEMLQFDIFALGGNSGSPCFVDFSNNRSGGFTSEHIPVMAILQGGWTDLNNRGVLLTPDKIDWARGGGRMSVAQSLSRVRPQIGGLPLMARNRSRIGGLPLMPASPRPPLYPVPSPAPAAARAQGLARPLARAFIVVDENNGMSVERRTFGHGAHDLTGKTTLSVRVPNLPAGGSIRWHIPDADDRTRVLFESGGSTSPSANGTTVTLRALSGGHASVDCMVRDASGTTIESNKYLVSAPQFISVAIDPTTDAYLGTLGLTSRRAAVIAEMRSMMQSLYTNVNMRFVFPSDTMPAHLTRGPDTDFPGGTEVQPSVYYVHVVGDESFIDPEETRDTGTPTHYDPGLIGRNHGIGEMDAPLDEHAISRILMNRFGAFFPDMTNIEIGLQAGGMAASDLDLAATLYGRVMGYISGHEMGHFMLAQLFGHDPAGGLMGGGTTDLTRVSGMSTTVSGSPILTDAGVGAATGLSGDMLRTFENVLAVNPPLDSTAQRARGRVGSFSLSTAPRGWRMGVSRAMSGETVHLPGATVLEGWQADAFIFAIEAAAKTVAASNTATATLAPLINVRDILDACDQHGITLGFGPSLGIGVQGGISGGYGIIFAPGRKIGFYGTYSSIVGWIYSAGLMAQLTVVKGDETLFGGDSRLAGITVETVGWFDTGMLGVPVGAHRIYNLQDQPIGYTFEVGIGAGVPVISLIEAYAQEAHTVTTFGHRSPVPQYGQALGVATGATDARAEAIARAVAAGAGEAEATAFVDALFT